MEVKPLINWTDGMKINKDHFNGLQESIIYMDSLIVQANTGKNRYGFFKDASGESTKIDLTVFNESINATIKNLRLILPSGVVVHSINENDILQIQYELDLGRNLEAGGAYLIIKVNPFDLVPFGQSEDLIQARKPHVRTDFSFELIECEKYNNGQGNSNSIPIAKIMVDLEGKLILQDDFIPASTDVKALTSLDVVCRSWIEQYNKLIATCSRILQQTLQNNQNTLQKFCIRLTDQILAKTLFERNRLTHSSSKLTAYDIISGIVDLSELFHLVCNSWPDELRAKLLLQLQNWQEAGINSNKIKIPSSLMNSYKHFDCVSSLDEAYRVLTDLHKYLMGIDANVSNVRIEPEENTDNSEAGIYNF